MRLHGSPTVERMPRTPRRVVALLLAGATLASLAACAPAAPAATNAPTDSPDATEAPIFASDEEALAAAVAAYERYLELDSVIAAEGGVEPDRIRAAVTDAYASELIGQYESQQRNGVIVTGKTTFAQPNLTRNAQQRDQAQIEIYGCAGVGDTRIFNSGGDDITPPDRDVSVPLLLSFESEARADTLLLSGSELWAGDDFC